MRVEPGIQILGPDAKTRTETECPQLAPFDRSVDSLAAQAAVGGDVVGCERGVTKFDIGYLVVRPDRLWPDLPGMWFLDVDFEEGKRELIRRDGHFQEMSNLSITRIGVNTE